LLVDDSRPHHQHLRATTRQLLGNDHSTTSSAISDRRLHRPRDIRDFADRAGCPDAYLPDNPTAATILTVLLEAERCAIRTGAKSAI